ncbi:hypothetical protein [Actinoplanes awajinensis]|uniref:Uncharacterized protein n=1 Tax=Actinoplanes awajinensis subsp. mycoplanecinus TaxID=135947 RepID=A0A0X3V2T8_9ACTN|nr:hypothetical protein [Actinoplanes awajinensis]KUL39105.1 hypothetical protein ADL15_10195 [Actinoplanes awajinensis subsp. mycoplanecinus]
MTVTRYAARTAAFAAAYLLAYWAGIPLAVLSPVAVAAVWMLAQGRWGLRRFDVITLATLTAASAIAHGAGMLMAFGLAAAVTLPAMIFAVLLERWLPGWWQGHGDRFRPRRTRLVRLAAVAALTAVTSVVLQAILSPEPSVYDVSLRLARDVVTLLAVTLAGRALLRPRTPQRTGLTLVR